MKNLETPKQFDQIEAEGCAPFNMFFSTNLPIVQRNHLADLEETYDKEVKIRTNITPAVWMYSHRYICTHTVFDVHMILDQEQNSICLATWEDCGHEGIPELF